MYPLCVVDSCGVIQTGGVCAHKRGQLLGGDVAAVKHVRHAPGFVAHAMQAVATICAADVIVAHIGSPFAVNHARWFNGRFGHAIEGVSFGVKMSTGDASRHGGLLSVVTGYMVGRMHTR